MRCLLAAAILATGYCGAAAAQAKIYHTSRTMAGAVEPGRIAVVGPFASIDKYCAGTTTAAIKIVQRPRNGALRLEVRSGPIEMGSTSEYRKCNDLSVRGSAVTYTPRQGFRGQDVFRFLLSFGDGERRLVTVPLTIQ